MITELEIRTDELSEKLNKKKISDKQIRTTNTITEIKLH